MGRRSYMGVVLEDCLMIARRLGLLLIERRVGVSSRYLLTVRNGMGVHLGENLYFYSTLHWNLELGDTLVQIEFQNTFYDYWSLAV